MPIFYVIATVCMISQPDICDKLQSSKDFENKAACVEYIDKHGARDILGIQRYFISQGADPSKVDIKLTCETEGQDS